MKWTRDQINEAHRIVNDIAERVDNRESAGALREALAIYADLLEECREKRSSVASEETLEVLKKLMAGVPAVGATPQVSMLLGKILDSGRDLDEESAPAEWVRLAKKLEKELGAVMARVKELEGDCQMLQGSLLSMLGELECEEPVSALLKLKALKDDKKACFESTKKYASELQELAELLGQPLAPFYRVKQRLEEVLKENKFNETSEQWADAQARIQELEERNTRDVVGLIQRLQEKTDREGFVNLAILHPELRALVEAEHQNWLAGAAEARRRSVD